MATNLLPRDGKVVLVAAALPAPDADRLLTELLAATNWGHLTVCPPEHARLDGP